MNCSMRQLVRLPRTFASQMQHGQVTEAFGPDGELIARKVVHGVNSRTVAELGRSLARWAEFCGLE